MHVCACATFLLLGTWVGVVGMGKLVESRGKLETLGGVLGVLDELLSLVFDFLRQVAGRGGMCAMFLLLTMVCTFQGMFDVGRAVAAGHPILIFCLAYCRRA